jgi:hypothetical protein
LIFIIFTSKQNVMIDENLQMYLPAFMLVATWLIIFWKQFRKVTRLTVTLPAPEKVIEYNRLKKISGYFWIIFSVFGIMTVIYSVLPELYYFFLPLDTFHHPIINSIGLLIMNIAIVWIAIAQVHIDKELFKYSRNIESLSAMELVRYSERMLLSGMLVFFIGFFTTITNIIGLVLVVLGIVIYVKTVSSKPLYDIGNN